MSPASSPDLLGAPNRPDHTPLRRAGILFAGGPAPAANAVISTCAISFIRNSMEAWGILNGYSQLVEYAPDRPLTEGRDYIRLDPKILRRTRNSQGIILGTARTNPGESINCPADLDDSQKAAKLRRVYEALNSLGIDCLISIGGDDTLKTANKFKLFQDRLPAGSKRIPIVHLPKTIDNDYFGIDFTFGYFTAVEQLAVEIHNLLYDAEATRTYYLAETMGRGAGWLAYGAAIAGEASLVIGVEDIQGKFRTSESYVDEQTKQTQTREIINVESLIDEIVEMMVTREREQKEFGVIVIAEGLAELLPYEHLKGIKRDPHGHINIAQVNLGKKFADWIANAYEKRFEGQRRRRVTGVQLGYEARCAKPHAFDVMLGSQLGVGAYCALVQQRLDGVMVSVEGQLRLVYRKFEELVDPETLVTKVRQIDPNSDFHQLARFLQTYLNK